MALVIGSLVLNSLRVHRALVSSTENSVKTLNASATDRAINFSRRRLVVDRSPERELRDSRDNLNQRTD